MSDLERLRREALRLPADERAALADELLASVDADGELELDPELLSELDRRLTGSGSPGETWESVRARVLAKYGG